MRTPSFWLLLLYTVMVYPIQAGISLHQAPHLIERGIAPGVAATHRQHVLGILGTGDAGVWVFAAAACRCAIRWRWSA